MLPAWSVLCRRTPSLTPSDSFQDFELVVPFLCGTLSPEGHQAGPFLGGCCILFPKDTLAAEAGEASRENTVPDEGSKICRQQQNSPRHQYH